MDLTNIYAAQKALDSLIFKNLPEGYDPESYYGVEDRNFAFQVEVMEFANELEFFKYWKHNRDKTRERKLSELADCIHLSTSIAITRGYDKLIDGVVYDIYYKDMPLIELFNIIRKRDIDSMQSYKLVMMLLLSIAEKVGFTEKEVYDAYMLKNKENHERQVNNY